MSILLFILAAAFFLIGCTEDATDSNTGNTTDTVKKQTTCPVMGGKINMDIYADHDGKRVYFCCPGCDAAFKKDPEKYIKKLEDAGVEIDKTP
ncbi:MAG: YHS domain-containing protein [Planctomycetota bacterium]|nr:MAG: YHS domain-containing protein [Planctomycetota bacterium]